MKIFKSKHKLKKEISNIKNISFVPTMGGLHKGHISLIKKSQSFGAKTLVSIFVNPKQFNEKKDFINYPRNPKKDLKILKRLKVDFVYIPTLKDIFSFRPKNKIFLDKSSKKLCGKLRKGHFEGVLNVVNRFLEIIKPKYIFLGMKDFQQVAVIQHMVRVTKTPVEIVVCDIIREESGLASSSRNVRLTEEQKEEALIISQTLNFLKSIVLE